MVFPIHWAHKKSYVLIVFQSCVLFYKCTLYVRWWYRTIYIWCGVMKQNMIRNRRTSRLTKDETKNITLTLKCYKPKIHNMQNNQMKTKELRLENVSRGQEWPIIYVKKKWQWQSTIKLNYIHIYYIQPTRKK